MTEPADLSAVDLLHAYRAAQLSPVEATHAALKRIEDANPELNAFCLVDPEQALAAARESEQRWHRGEPVGLLDGVPTSIKDLVLTAGWPTLRGSHLIDPDQPWDEDAPATARLREHGAVLIGKTTSPEFGWKGVTDSPLHGVTGNPWNPQRTAGGSSGGSAAAVARGMGPLSIGTDGGGSIRIPAGFSGIFGLKPTYGRVPHYPASPFGTLAHVGPMTRTVADSALMLDVLALPDPRDWSALPVPTTTFRTAVETPVTGLRIAYSPDLGYVDVDPEIAAAVRRAVDVLEQLGAQVEQVDPGFTDPVDAYEVLWFSGVAKVLSAFGESAIEKIDPGLAAGVASGRDLTASDYLDATAVRVDLGRRMGLFHQRFDLLVTPALPIAAFEAGHDVPPGSAHREWTGWTPFSYPFNLTQQPAASVPCGFTSDGLPIGLQVVGPRHADATVLAACHAYERARS